MDLSAFFESDVPVEVQKNEEFLAKLDEEGWRRFLSVAQRLTFRANETVVSQADISRTFYLVARGRLEVVAKDIQGATRHVDFIEPLSIFGEQAFFDGYPRSATVVALTEGELYESRPTHLKSSLCATLTSHALPYWILAVFFPFGYAK